VDNFDFIAGRRIKKRKIRRAGRNPVIQAVKILTMKHFKGKISGLRDQVGSHQFVLKLLAVLYMLFFFFVRCLLTC